MRKLLPMLVLGIFASGMAQPATSPKPDFAKSDKLTAEKKSEILDSVNKIMEESAFVPGIDFKKWPSYIEAEKDPIDKATTPMELVMAVNHALHNFGASHIVMSTPQMAEARVSKQGVGMGVQIQPEPGKGIWIVNVFPGSAADDAGLKPGDLITMANGKKVEGAPDLQGDEGTTVTLTIVREKKTLKIKVTRRKYSNVRPETLTWPDKDTAVIKIWTFDMSYDRDNVEKLMGQASKAKNLIVDLRSNPGGAVLNLMHFLGMVMPDRANAGAFLARRDVDRYLKNTGGKPTDYAEIAKQSMTILRPRTNKNVPTFTGKVAVLVDGGSGSAAEIAAAALSEEINAPVLGSKSAGAVLASIMSPLPYGYLMQYPIMDYVSPKGHRLEGSGVSPDLETKQALKFGEKDDTIDKAIALLNKTALGTK